VSKERSRGIIGIFVLTTVLFFIFIIFAFYTVANLRKASDETSLKFNTKNAPIAVVEVEGVIMESRKTIKKLLNC
jgi:ClpP class serine protease